MIPQPSQPDPRVASSGANVIRLWQVSHTLTVRLNKELAAWLEHAAAETGMSQGQIVRDQLEKARTAASARPFMRLAGAVRNGPRDLSRRKGFSKA